MHRQSFKSVDQLYASVIGKVILRGRVKLLEFSLSLNIVHSCIKNW